MDKIKTKVIITVQGSVECAADFAIRLEELMEKIYNYYPIAEYPTIQCMTSDNVGKQTATIQFKTIVKKDQKKTLLVEGSEKAPTPKLRPISYEELHLMMTRLAIDVRENPDKYDFKETCSGDIAEFIRQENFRRDLFLE